MEPTTDEMLAEFKGHEQAVWNAGVIADMCNFDFETDKLFFPQFVIFINSGVGLAAFNMWQSNKAMNDRRNNIDKVVLRDILTKNIMEELEKGHTTIYKHKEISETFHLYKSSGGNGTSEALYDKYNNLDIKGE